MPMTARRARGSDPEAREGGAGESMGRVLDFMRTVWALDHALVQASRRMERVLGVTGPQRLVIRLVGRDPGMSAGALAQTLHVHPSTLTGVLQRLTDRGVLERTADPDDARRVRLRLTRKGEKLDATQSGTVEAKFREALATVSARDLGVAERVLKRITDVLSDTP